MQFERGKPPETPNAPCRAARIKDERWRSAGPGFEPGRAGPQLSLASSQDAMIGDLWFTYGSALSCNAVRQKEEGRRKKKEEL
jgi:hypothetical protein